MNHESFRRLLAVRDFLSPAEAAQLEAHLWACAACREEAALYAQQDTGLRSLSFPDPPAGVRSGVWERVARPASPPLWAPRRLRLALVPAGLALLAVAALLLGRPFQPAPSSHTAAGSLRVTTARPATPFTGGKSFGPVDGASRKQLPSHPTRNPADAAHRVTPAGAVFSHPSPSVAQTLPTPTLPAAGVAVSPPAPARDEPARTTPPPTSRLPSRGAAVRPSRPPRRGSGFHPPTAGGAASHPAPTAALPVPTTAPPAPPAQPIPNPAPFAPATVTPIPAVTPTPAPSPVPYPVAAAPQPPSPSPTASPAPLPGSGPPPSATSPSLPTTPLTTATPPPTPTPAAPGPNRSPTSPSASPTP